MSLRMQFLLEKGAVTRYWYLGSKDSNATSSSRSICDGDQSTDYVPSTPLIELSLKPLTSFMWAQLDYICRSRFGGKHRGLEEATRTNGGNRDTG